ncbi:F-box protein [Rhizoctonia solani AG-3 Rhs1AP]|uniref:F-box protein n=1 Tax=Rhizoctonia solani AG-3 Rhs1AP TaxID=1086054 RepID=X8IX49_9AGAM|nr:F-box protein [Rhizoctonia solani AG-3 Rhs1AP]
MKTRRQARLLEESKGVGEQDDVSGRPVDIEQDGSVNSTYGDPPQRKKRAVGNASKSNTAKPPNRIKGKLSGVFSLPVEVFMEIIQHLPLPDVLSLSRSNRFFYQILMTRSMATLHVWRAAVENVPGLPRCPDDLCEPQYATLIYSKHCTMCGTSVVRSMDPYLNVRLCKDCVEVHVTHVNEIPEGLQDLVHNSNSTRMKASQHGMRTCLIRDKEEFEKWIDYMKTSSPMTERVRRAEIEKRLATITARLEYARNMEQFLRNMAEARIKQIDQLKEQRRQDVKRRLEEAGWEEADWTFPEFVARKWASLVEAPQALTDRAWQKLYPDLVPYLEKNRESQAERSKIIRRGKRLRRMRRLLLAIRNSNALFETDKEEVQDLSDQENLDDLTTNASDASADGTSASEGEGDSTADESSNDHDVENPNHPTPIVSHLGVKMPFPPMVDLLEWPIVSELLEDDTDADTMQARFEELRDEVEDQIRSWGSTVEEELADILKAGRASDNSLGNSEHEDQSMDLDSEVPLLQLQTENALTDHLTPTTRLLLRADSVFRVSEDIVAPLPLYFPDIFPVLQDRPDGYCTIAFRKLEGYDLPKHGYTWDPDEVLYYPEGCTAAKALLRQLGRIDAAHFELQAMGPRFTCGCCGDNWLRTWDEMVQHYAEAIVHAGIAKKAKASVRKQVEYTNVHALGPDDKTKRKRKPIVILHSIEDAKVLSSKRRKWESLVKCNLCERLGVDFQSPRDVMLKHVRTVHSIKAPKAERYKRTPNMRNHTKVGDPMGIVSDSTEATDPEILNEIISEVSNYGMAVFWSYFGPHSHIHPGWDRRDFR